MIYINGWLTFYFVLSRFARSEIIWFELFRPISQKYFVVPLKSLSPTPLSCTISCEKWWRIVALACYYRPIAKWTLHFIEKFISILSRTEWSQPVNLILARFKFIFHCSNIVKNFRHWFSSVIIVKTFYKNGESYAEITLKLRGIFDRENAPNV